MNPEAKIRCQIRMGRVDMMTPALRAVVHQWGLTVVDAFLDSGIGRADEISRIIASIHQGEPSFPRWVKPNHRRNIIAKVIEGSVEIGNRDRPTPSSYGEVV